MVIEGVDRYRVLEPMVEAVRVVLNHRREPYTPAYVQGIAGTAFTIGGICPCAPTAGAPHQPDAVLKLFGYESECVKYVAAAPDAEAQYAAFLDRLKREIRAGRPVLAWNAFTNYEWDVVCGYDDVSGTLTGYGSYAGGDSYASSPQDRCKGAMDVTDVIAVVVGDKTGELDRPVAEARALRFAVDHANSRKNADKFDKPEWAFFEGLMCYERWARDFTDPQRKRGVGDSYCLNILASTRRAAAGFLEELSARHPSAASALNAGARSFAEEAVALDALKPLLGWDAPEGPDAERNRQASDLIGQASAHYRRAIESIDRIEVRLIAGG